MAIGVSEDLRLYLRMEAEIIALEVGGEEVTPEVRAEARAIWERLSDAEQGALEKRESGAGMTRAWTARALPEGAPITHVRASFSKGLKNFTLCGTFDEGRPDEKKYNADKKRMELVTKGRAPDRAIDVLSVEARAEVTCVACKKLVKERDAEILASWTRRKRKPAKGRS